MVETVARIGCGWMHGVGLRFLLDLFFTKSRKDQGELLEKDKKLNFKTLLVHWLSFAALFSGNRGEGDCGKGGPPRSFRVSWVWKDPKVNEGLGEALSK